MGSTGRERGLHIHLFRASEPPAQVGAISREAGDTLQGGLSCPCLQGNSGCAGQGALTGNGGFFGLGVGASAMSLHQDRWTLCWQVHLQEKKGGGTVVQQVNARA